MSSVRARAQGVGIDSRGYPIVMLLTIGEHCGGVFMPIWIGLIEAVAIQAALEQKPLPRPMTHDLLRNILNALKVRLINVEIIDFYDNAYYAVIRYHRGDVQGEFDCRPSDAIALALRMNTPILINENILNQHGFWPENSPIDLDQETKFRNLIEDIEPETGG